MFINEASNISNALHYRAHMSWVFDYFRDQLDIDYFSKKNSILIKYYFKLYLLKNFASYKINLKILLIITCFKLTKCKKIKFKFY